MSELQQLRDRVDELEELLGVRAEFPPDLRIKASWRPILGMLLKRDIVTRDMLWTVLFGARPGHQPNVKIIDCYICHLRAALRRHGISIARDWGVGWHMTADNKARLRAVIAALSCAPSVSEER